MSISGNVTSFPRLGCFISAKYCYTPLKFVYDIDSSQPARQPVGVPRRKDLSPQVLNLFQMADRCRLKTSDNREWPWLYLTLCTIVGLALSLIGKQFGKLEKKGMPWLSVNIDTVWVESAQWVVSVEKVHRSTPSLSTFASP